MRQRTGDGRGILALTVGVGAISWAAIFVRLAEEAPALTIAAYRMLFAAAVLAVAAGIAIALRRDRIPVWSRWPLLGLSGCFLAGHFWSWFASLERTSVGSSVVIVAMQPLLGALLGFLFLGERPTRNEYAGLALGGAGVLVIGGGDLAGGTEALLGDALALLGGFFHAAYRTVGRHVRADTSAAVYSAAVYTAAACALWLLVAVLRPQVTGFGGETWTYLVLLALVPQVIGHTVLNWALAHFRIVAVGIANLGEPLLATLLAIPILAEHPGAGLLAGGPLVIAGLFVGLQSHRPVTEQEGGLPAGAS